MSNTFYETRKILLTACVKENASVQLTLKYNIKDRFIHLSNEEAIELAVNLLMRANGHVSATGSEEGSYGCGIFKNE